jgi:hypothetical protein
MEDFNITIGERLELGHGPSVAVGEAFEHEPHERAS